MAYMKIGFTGTHLGMTPRQTLRVGEILTAMKPSEFHHGDCIGADIAAHALAQAREIVPVIHPPIATKSRAFCQGGVVLPAKDYLPRNRDIVDAVDFMLATPRGPELLRSGTWSTIRYARRVGKPILVIMPNGSSFSEDSN